MAVTNKIGGMPKPPNAYLTWVPAVSIALAASASAFVAFAGTESAAVHWNIRGKVDRVGDPTLLTIAFPFVMLVHFVATLPLRPKKDNPVVSPDLIWIPIILGLPLHLWLLRAMGGWSPDLEGSLIAAAALLITVSGIAMPYSTRNSFFGIRTPRTLASDDEWARAHSVGGPFVTVGGVATLSLVPLLAGATLLLVALAVLIITPVAATLMVSHKPLKQTDPL